MAYKLRIWIGWPVFKLYFVEDRIGVRKADRDSNSKAFYANSQESGNRKKEASSSNSAFLITFKVAWKGFNLLWGLFYCIK